jgi:hypothetical protein
MHESGDPLVMDRIVFLMAGANSVLAVTVAKILCNVAWVIALCLWILRTEETLFNWATSLKLSQIYVD